jgi:hypothetical protein
MRHGKPSSNVFAIAAAVIAVIRDIIRLVGIRVVIGVLVGL